MSKKKKVDTRHLMHGVCHLNMIPMRFRPANDQMMVSQLLFGETLEVIEKKNKQWFKVKSSVDGTAGYINAHQITLINETDFKRFTLNKAIVLDVCQSIFNEENTKSIVIGSSLPVFDGMSCTMPDAKYIFNGQAIQKDGLEFSAELLIKIAKRFIWSPEIIGGRSPFGIDSSALVQIIFSIFGVVLPRFAPDQSAIGTIIDFIELSEVGDLVFCQDDNVNISHVGVIIGDRKVIHAYGHVRIDKIDHFGIYNSDIRKYSHKLRFIKRLPLSLESIKE